MWWTTIIVVALLAFGIVGFVSMVRLFTQRLTSETTRGAEDMYDQYADSPRERHRRSLASRRYWPVLPNRVPDSSLRFAARFRAWPSAWPSPSGPLGWQRSPGSTARRRRVPRSNAASLSRAAGGSISAWQFLGYGPALSAAGAGGPGRAYRPRPVLERKPRRVHSASWVSRFGGFTPSRLASSLPDQSWPGWLAMMRVTWSLLLPGQGGRGPGRAAGSSGGGARRDGPGAGPGW